MQVLSRLADVPRAWPTQFSKRVAARIRRARLLFHAGARRRLAPAAKRGMDLALAVAALLTLAPVLLATALVCRGKVRRDRRTGRGGRLITLYRFRLPAAPWRSVFRRTGAAQLPLLWNIARGDLAWIGPRAVRPGACPVKHRRRHMDRPGLVCLWWIRKKANIDYGNELAADHQYVETRSLGGDWGIALRALWVSLLGGRRASPRDLQVLGIPLCNIELTDAADKISEQLECGSQAAQYCFVNADCANLADRDPDYRQCLLNSTANFADGIGIKLAARMARDSVRQNVNGTDLFPELMSRMDERRHRLFLLGGEPGVADATAAWIARRYPHVQLCGCRHGYFSPADDADVVREIAASQADLLLVAFGAPRQDLWIQRRLGELNVAAAIGVGGLFDFFSGRRRRAPQWMRELGLEWAFRMWLEPTRLGPRYLIGNTVFLARAARAAFQRRFTS